MDGLEDKRHLPISSVLTPVLGFIYAFTPTKELVRILLAPEIAVAPGIVLITLLTLHVNTYCSRASDSKRTKCKLIGWIGVLAFGASIGQILNIAKL